MIGEKILLIIKAFYNQHSSELWVSYKQLLQLFWRDCDAKLNPNPAKIFSNQENIAPTGLFILPGTVKIKVFELRKAKRSVIQALKLSVSLYL